MHVTLPCRKSAETDVRSFLFTLKEWLLTNVGEGTWLIRIEPRDAWSGVYLPYKGVVELWFRDPRYATLCKLTWGGTND